MRSRDALACALVLLAPLAGCGDFAAREDGGPVVAEPCAWPIESATPGGSIELGLDRSGFVPLPEEVTFIEGSQTQGGVLLLLQARMVGLEAGGGQDYKDPRNPRTRFSATYADGTSFGRECPSRVGYVPSGEDGAVERVGPAFLEFEPLTKAEPGFNTVVKLKVEVIDADGRYASDEREVFCRAPGGWHADAGPADAGPAADGGVADASAETDAAM